MVNRIKTTGLESPEEKVVNESLKKTFASQAKANKKIGKKQNVMPSEQMRKNNPKGAKKTLVKNIKKKVGPKLFKEVDENTSKSNRDSRISYKIKEDEAISGKKKDPRMQAGKFRTFGSSRKSTGSDRIPLLRAKGGTVRMASGGPVVDSYDY